MTKTELITARGAVAYLVTDSLGSVRSPGTGRFAGYLRAVGCSNDRQDVLGRMGQVACLTRARIRPSCPSRWRLASVLLAVAVLCLVAGCGPARYGPGSGTLTGIIARCTPAEEKASGGAPDPSRVVIVSAQNNAGKIVASQRLPFRTSGARYRIRLLAGTYFINAVSTFGDSSGFTVTVTADEETEYDVNDGSEGSCVM